MYGFVLQGPHFPDLHNRGVECKVSVTSGQNGQNYDNKIKV